MSVSMRPRGGSVARLSATPMSGTTNGGYPWSDGQQLYAADLNAAIAGASAIQGLLNVKSFGAVGDGVTDDTAAFVAALAAVAGGGALIIPPGTYDICAALPQTITGTASLIGAGSGATVLSFAAATDGLLFTLAPGGGNIHVRGLTIARAASGAPYANTGLSISVASAQTARNGTPSVHDVHLMGNTARTTGWAIGISVIGVSSISLTDVFYSAPDSDGSGLGRGIYITGVSATAYIVEVALYNCSTQGGSIGVDLNTWIQGVYVANSRFIGHDYGIRWPGVAANSDVALLITNVHCNCSTACVYTYGASGIIISNLLTLHFPSPSLTGDYAGIDITACSGLTISNSNFASGDPGFAGTENAIKLTSGNQTTIIGNEFDHMKDYLIALNNMNIVTMVGNAAYSPGSPGFVSYVGGGNVLKVGNMFNGNIDDAGVNVSDGIFYTTGSATHGGSLVVFGDLLVNGQINGDTTIEGNLTVNGDTSKFGSVDSSGAARVIVDGTTLTYRVMGFTTNALGRWFIGANATAESGGNAGSDFTITSGNDAGTALIGAPLTIKRSTGVVTFGSTPTLGAPLNQATNDAGAASTGVPLGGLYRNGSVMMVRVT